MEYKDFVKDFARRTYANLQFIQSESDSRVCEVYEITQLINSFLGFIVFPKERYFRNIPYKTLDKLIEENWSITRFTINIRKVNTLRDLLIVMRNSASHSNFEFYSNENYEISRVKMWNINRSGIRDWETTMTINEIKSFIESYYPIILDL